MADNNLSLCLIVKNEEKSLERCLKSVCHIADEIIVVDTGSEDKTVDIAKKYNAKVIYHKWNNNFSEARNKSLKYATKKWILFLDADEEIPYEDGLMLKRILNEYSHMEGFNLKLINTANGKFNEDAVVFRVFRNNNKYRFKGRIHEQIIPSIYKENPNSIIGDTGIRIIHYGYDPSLINILEKQQRNIRILNEYQEKDKDGYYYYSLGNEYARVNDNKKALEIFEKALDYLNKKDSKDVYIPYLYSNMIKALFNDNKIVDAISLSKEFTENLPDFKDLYFYQCACYFKAGYFSKSLQSLEKYLKCSENPYGYPAVNFESIFNLNSQDTLKYLRNISVSHKENLISVLIIPDKNNTECFETIRTVNEIADEVLFLNNLKNNLDDSYIENIKNMGCKVISLDFKDNKDMFMEGCKKCTGEFIFLLKSDELFPPVEYKNIVNTLENAKENYFCLQVIDKSIKENSLEFRVYRNIDELKNIDDFNEYASYIYIRPIKKLPIYIEKNK